MDFTREPIVETIITPKDGYRIVVRNSKNPGQEEFFVEALEVVTFGSSCFFRSLERPRPFLVPASEYEVLEVRENRLALKAAQFEGVVRTPVREPLKTQNKEIERREPIIAQKEFSAEIESALPEEIVKESETIVPPAQVESRNDRRKDRRKLPKRRKGREDSPEEVKQETRKDPQPIPEAEKSVQVSEIPSVPVPDKEVVPSTLISTILPPPTTLIRDDLDRPRRNERYKGAFYIRNEEGALPESEDDDDAPIVPLSLLGDEESVVRQEESPEPPKEEENIYKATPAPIEDSPFGREKTGYRV